MSESWKKTHHALGSHGKREHLGGNDPSERTWTGGYQYHGCRCPEVRRLTPRNSKGGDEDVDERDGCVTGGLVVVEIVAELGNDGGDDSKTDGHDSCTAEELIGKIKDESVCWVRRRLTEDERQTYDGLSTKVVHPEDGGNGENQVDDTDDTGGQEGNGTTGQTNLLEDGGS
jgi:hypothetical protein